MEVSFSKEYRAEGGHFLCGRGGGASDYPLIIGTVPDYRIRGDLSSDSRFHGNAQEKRDAIDDHAVCRCDYGYPHSAEKYRQFAFG